MLNLLLIDDAIVEKQLFINGVNSQTTPKLFSEIESNPTIEYTTIDRIAIAFHGSPIIPKFIHDNLEQIIVKCGASLTRIDFLGCRTLTFDEWKTYYATLK
jgi:hypothetical protein